MASPLFAERRDVSFRIINRMRKLARLFLVLLTGYGGGCVLAGFFLAELAAHPERRPIGHATRAEAIAVQERAELRDVQIVAQDGAALHAWYVRPHSPNGRDVILLHGVSDNREGMGGYGEMFLAHGYTVLLPDSRAHGESGGRMATYGILESNDVRRWVEWLEAEDRPGCVYGLGESMGAAIVLQSLRVEPHFCAVAAESSFSTFREVAYDRIGQHLDAGPWLGRTALRPAVETAFLLYRAKYGIDLAKANPEDVVSTTHVPILLIHGLADSNIRPWHSEQLKASNPGEVTLWKVPGAAHCGAVTVAPVEFEDRVLGFFAAHDRQAAVASRQSN